MIRLVWLLLAITLYAAPAPAHLTPNSEIGLDFGAARVDAALVIPLGELRYADPSLTWQSPAALKMWLLAHMAVTAPDGRAWRIVADGAYVGEGPSPDVEAKLLLFPPAGAPLRQFTLRYTGVIDRLSNHFVLVMLRSDFAGGHLSDHPQMLGALREGAMEMTVDRGPGSAWRGFRAAIGLGMHHIAEGHDHLLFLIVLLLPAPMLAQRRQWTRYAGWRHTARSLVAIVTAFTIGHSITLVGGAFFGWQLPAPPVEMAIALSILISAIHAWRPIFAGREAWVAGGFGLVHGLAFATIIGRFGIEPLQKAQSILGFNLGIELVQLGVVALATPGLLLLARGRHYDAIRTVAAGLAAVAAALWFVERATGHDLSAGRMMDEALGYAPWMLGGLAIAAGVARLSSALRTS